MEICSDDAQVLSDNLTYGAFKEKMIPEPFNGSEPRLQHQGRGRVGLSLTDNIFHESAVGFCWVSVLVFVSVDYDQCNNSQQATTEPDMVRNTKT